MFSELRKTLTFSEKIAFSLKLKKIHRGKIKKLDKLKFNAINSSFMRQYIVNSDNIRLSVTDIEFIEGIYFSQNPQEHAPKYGNVLKKT